MRTEIPLEEAAGRTVERILCPPGEQAIITFTDGTFTTLGIVREDEMEWLAGVSLQRLAFGDEWIVDAGIASQEELDAERAGWKDRLRAKVALQEREQYERLRTKFEPGGGA